MNTFNKEDAKMVTLQTQVDTSHEDMIHDAQMDYYGTRLATCSSDKSVKIFEITNNQYKQLAKLCGHEGPVWQLAWAHPKYENLLASCSYDKKVIIWKETSTNQWEKLYETNNHDSSVNSVCWAPHELGLILAAGSSDGSISVLSCNVDSNVWDVKKIQNAHSIGCNSVSWGPVFPPTNFSYTPQKRIVSGGCDNLVKIWLYTESEDKWIEEQKLEAHSDWVRDVAWAPSTGLPKTLIASCSQDRRVIIWTKSLAKANQESSSSGWAYNVLNTFDDVVWHVSWSIMGNILAVSGGDNKVSLWKETPDGRWICISGLSQTNK
ncbi:GTPase-activating protein S13 [Dermatophagoides pteronyssinus]|nr:GTPase-activating protein S13 [Dermatophagoides pteronyssinus]